MPNETTVVTVVITDLTNNDVSSIAELPEHLHNWTTNAIAAWAVERDDATHGRAVELDYGTDTDYFGADENSYTMYYRAGARFQVSVTVIYSETTYRVTFPDNESLEFRSEEMAVTMAGTVEGCTLGHGTVIV